MYAPLETIIPENCFFFFFFFFNVALFQNIGQITDFYLTVVSILAKIWKTTFPKEFFNEIWLKVGEHKQIYITEITFWKKYSVSKWQPK